MRHDITLYRTARKLRLTGKTYSEIKRLTGKNIPKSTLSSWCCDIELPQWYEEKVKHLNEKNLSKAQKMAWFSNKTKQEKIVENIFKNNQHVVKKLNDQKVFKMLLAMLYLGEGCKWKSHRGMMLGSSDPDIIRLYLCLLYLCYGIKPKMLHCRVSYRADQDIRALEKYWAKIIGIPLKNFYKTIPDPRTIGKPTKKTDYKGVCVIVGGRTEIQLELGAISKIILKNFGGVAQLARAHRWQR